MPKHVILPVGPEALQREGLRDIPEVWEDGLRAAPKSGNFEWWYFDSHFEDGTTAVIVFFTKSLLDRSSPLKPGVSITITRPDGVKVSETSLVPSAAFSASKERCYVRAGESWVRGDLCNYELHAKTDTMTAQLNFTGQVPAWRPGTGKIFFDEAQTHYFAWLPAIPYGAVEGRLIYDGKMRTVRGACYHDHNWGNVGLNQMLSSWYWGRAHVGDYTLIFAEMHATRQYGEQAIPILMLAKGSQILIGDGGPLQVTEGEFIADPGGRSYPDKLDLDWQMAQERVHLKLRDPRLIDSFSLLDLLPTWQRIIGRLVANPYYFRFNASLDLQLSQADAHTRVQGQALYELMLLR